MEKYNYLFKDMSFISKVEFMYNETLAQFSTDGIECLVGDPDPEGMNPFDRMGDIGVSEFERKDPAELSRMLGFGVDCSGYSPFPYFNGVRSELGLIPSKVPDFENLNKFPERLPPNPTFQDVGLCKTRFDEYDAMLEKHQMQRFVPRWHQFVGLAAILRRLFNGDNVLLADGVGVGKTLQVYMLIAYMRRMFAVERETRKPAVPPFGKWPSAQSISYRGVLIFLAQ